MGRRRKARAYEEQDACCASHRPEDGPSSESWRQYPPAAVTNDDLRMPRYADTDDDKAEQQRAIDLLENALRHVRQGYRLPKGLLKALEAKQATLNKHLAGAATINSVHRQARLGRPMTDPEKAADPENTAWGSASGGKRVSATSTKRAYHRARKKLKVTKPKR